MHDRPQRVDLRRRRLAPPAGPGPRLAPKGSRPSDSSQVDVFEARRILRKDCYVATGAASRDSVFTSWQDYHNKAWCQHRLESPAVSVMPLTADRVEAVTGLMTLDGSKAFANYVCVMQAHHVKHGLDWCQLLEVTVKECTRTILRGAGSARQSG